MAQQRAPYSFTSFLTTLPSGELFQIVTAIFACGSNRQFRFGSAARAKLLKLKFYGPHCFGYSQNKTHHYLTQLHTWNIYSQIAFLPDSCTTLSLLVNSSQKSNFRSIRQMYLKGWTANNLTKFPLSKGKIIRMLGDFFTVEIWQNNTFNSLFLMHFLKFCHNSLICPNCATITPPHGHEMTFPLAQYLVWRA